MNSPFDWPALQCDRQPASFEYERGVWGKAHGAPTDFRWIARTAGFGRAPDLHQQLSLGGEDLPASFQAWRNLGDVCYAIHAYPSRAIDAAGRRGFLEKQVLEWRPPQGASAALGALLLLPCGARMTDEIWWDRSAGVPWSRPDSVLAIDEADHQPLVMDEQSLAAAIERGRDALRDVLDQHALLVFYEQLLASDHPAFLTGLRQPLPPEALAALLLPLPRAISDRISLAGWVPTSRPIFGELASRWDVVVTTANPQAASQRSLSDRRAEQMARQLLAEEPLESFAPQRKEMTTTPARPRAASVSSEHMLRPMRPLDLKPPDGGVETILFDLYEFARMPSRRWLEPKALADRDRIPRLTPDSAASICDWVRQVCDRPPGYADPEQWQVKVDLLRSAALVLAPYPATLRQVGAPGADSRVPALLFGLLLPPDQSDRLGDLGLDVLEQLLDQSFLCNGTKRWGSQLRRWLQQWEDASRRQDVRMVIRNALRSRALAL
jgi:hypothetical protein